LVAKLARRIHRLLARRRVLDAEAESDVPDPWMDESLLAGLSAASVQGRMARWGTVRRHGSAVWRRVGRGAAATTVPFGRESDGTFV
jgi:hypothetical protein